MIKKIISLEEYKERIKQEDKKRVITELVEQAKKIPWIHTQPEESPEGSDS